MLMVFRVQLIESIQISQWEPNATIAGPVDISEFSKAQGYLSINSVGGHHTTLSTWTNGVCQSGKQQGWQGLVDGFVLCKKCSCVFTDGHIGEHKIRCKIDPQLVTLRKKSATSLFLLQLNSKLFGVSDWRPVMVAFMVGPCYPEACFC